MRSVSRRRIPETPDNLLYTMIAQRIFAVNVKYLSNCSITLAAWAMARQRKLLSLVRCSSVIAGYDAIKKKRKKTKETVERMHELHTTYVRNSNPSRNSRRYVYFLSLSLSVSLYQFSLLYILYFIYIYIATLYVLSILFTFSSPFFLSKLRLSRTVNGR